MVRLQFLYEKLITWN